jgi:hypothetical protein
MSPQAPVEREHKATFTDNRRFRRQPSKYLAELEARAAEIASQQYHGNIGV